jgi:hypothetical protein
MISRSRYLRLALALALALGVGSGACAPAKTTAKAPPRFGKVDEKPTKQPWMQGKQSVGEAEVLTVESGVAGDRISSLLEVPETDCAVVIARATPSVDDVDLFAYGEDGAVLGSDEGSDKQPALLVCPPHPRRIFLAARIAAGHGLVALGAQRVHVRDAERVAKAYGVRYRPGELARRMSVWPGLDEQLEQHRRTLGGSWVDLRRVAVPLDARTPTRLSATVDAERCLDLLVVPSDEIVALDVTLLDAEGRIVGRARGGGRDRSLVVCSATPSAVTLELRPHVGIGLAIAMMSRSREGTEADIDADVTRLDLYPTQGVGPERERRAAELTRLGLPGGRLVTTGTLPLGQRKSVSFELPAGCSRLDLVAGTPLRGVDAWLYADDGSLLASSSGPSPVLYACAAGGRVRLDAESLFRPGPFALEQRAEPGTPKALVEHPLAASRLLGRMVEHGVIATARRVGAVYVHPVGPNALARQTLLVPVGRCLDVTGAIGPGASGFEIRLVSSDNQQIALGSGEHSTSVRACAIDSRGGDIVAELRTSTGSATALLTAHQVDPRAKENAGKPR